MADWPDIKNPSDITERNSKAQIRSDFSGGYVQSMPKWTRSRKRFELTWEAMSSSDKSKLETFFKDNIGDTFTWNHPLEEKEYTVRFAEDELEFSYVPVKHWQISLSLEEK